MEKKFLLLIMIGLVMTSCKTFYMTPASLKTQLENVDPNKISDSYDFRLGAIGAALKGGKNFYNGIEELEVTDKEGHAIRKQVTTNTGIRLTDDKGKRVTLYFDSMFLRDSLVYGSKSHFITMPITPMNVNKLVKIELQ